MNHKRPQAGTGFTLTELLVVIVIIGTLAALSFVGVRTIRQSAQVASCAENLRTWGIAIHGYSADNNGMVPWYGWASISNDSRFYETYLGGDGVNATATMDGRSLLSTQLHRRCPGQKWDRMGNGPAGYAMVRPNPKIPDQRTFNISTASNPSQMLLMIDANKLNLSGPEDIATGVLPLTTAANSRHRQTVNALFADGHVQAFRRADLAGSSKGQKAMLERWFTLR